MEAFKKTFSGTTGVLLAIGIVLICCCLCAVLYIVVGSGLTSIFDSITAELQSPSLGG